LTSIGFDDVVASDHAHELHNVMEGLVVPGREDDTSRMQCVMSSLEVSQSSIPSNPAEQNVETNIFSDDDMELSPESQREIDLILEKHNKRARGHGEEDGECRKPPYPRVARAAVPSSQVRRRAWADDELIANLEPRHSIHPIDPIPVHIDVYYPHFHP
jgi:hypothetical protein